MFKYETHIHTQMCSKCAHSTGKELVDKAKELGYAGFVITNHFWGGNSAIDRNLGWERFVEAYKTDYEIAKEYGEQIGIQVFFGVEEGVGGGKEILIYGISPDDLIRHPEWLEISLEEKCNLIHSLGGIVFLAHPFRNRAYILEPDVQPNPDFFDGVEGYNKCNPKEENEKAFDFAEKHRLLTISGGDVHSTSGFGGAGIEFAENPKDYADLLAKIMQRDFTLLTK